MRPPYNLQTVTRGLFLQRNRATPEHRGQFSNASCKGSSSSSYQPRPCNVWPTTISVDGRACSYGVSNDKVADHHLCGWACMQQWCLKRQGGRPPPLWMGVHAAMVDQTTRWPTTISVDGRACSYGGSNDKLADHHLCGWACMQLWCLKRQSRRLRAVGCMSYSRGGTATGRLEAGQLNTLRVCCCCRLAGVTPANSIGLDSTVFFVRESW